MRATGTVLERPPPIEDQATQLIEGAENFLRIQETSAKPRTEQPKVVPEAAVLREDERVLTEVDNLNRYRLPDGTHGPWALDEVLKNLIPYVKEGGMPSAISNTYQEFVANYEDDDGRRNTFLWLGRTAIQVARSGYAYHRHPAALERVDVEIEEARDSEQNLRPGMAKVFISPRISDVDASPQVAKAEHLGAADALRVSWLDVDERGKIKGKHLESLLVQDIPLQVWVDMLADPRNIFGKSILVERRDSALSVMKVFANLELPSGALPEGTVSILVALSPYIKDEKTLGSIEKQIADFRQDQAGKHEKAVSIAQRWREFEVALADSIDQKLATPEVEAFVNQLQNEWNDDDLQLIQSHRYENGSLFMTRKLAARLEEAKRHFLLVSASVVTDNEKVLEQIDYATAQRIRHNEMRIQRLRAEGSYRQAHQLETQNQYIIAHEDIVVGGGCLGESAGGFRKDGDENDRKSWEIKKGKCVVPNCPTRPAQVNVGPCGVCMDRCQRIYDKGGDPAKGVSLKMVIRPAEKPRET